MSALTAAAIIETLGMIRHPEGGWYVETFREAAGSPRGHSTAIYYLLERGERSHWHRVRDAAEVWHHYAGAPLALGIAEDGKSADTLTLARTFSVASGRRLSFRPTGGSRRNRSGTGHWSAAPSRLASTSQPSKWPRRAGSLRHLPQLRPCAA